MKEAIAKGYQKSQSRSRARARARDFLGKRGSQSQATFFSMSKKEPRAEPLKKWPGSPSLVYCIPESFNTNISYQLFDNILTFVNSQH